MKTLLIQQGKGEAYREMLRLTSARHRDYATRHDMDLWTVSGPVQLERPPIWDKTMLLRRALALDYELVAWLDADTLICDLECDLRAAAREFEHIGMTRHGAGWGTHSELGWHYNAGVIFIRPSLMTIQALDKIWTLGDNGSSEDQTAVMDLWAECPGLFRTLAYRWNAFAVAPCDDAAVLAWHGFEGDRVAAMGAALAKL